MDQTMIITYHKRARKIWRVWKEFEAQFNCLGKNTVKYITFSVPIEKEVKTIDKYGGEITKTIS